MSTSGNGWERTASRPRDGVNRRFRSVVPLCAASVLALLFTGLLVAGGIGPGSGATPAVAAPTASPSPRPSAPEEAPTADPSPSSPPDTGTPPAHTAPVIQSPVSGQLVSSPLEVSGTGTPGSSVQILLTGSSEPLCIVTPDASGAWSCTASGIQSSSSTTIRAVEIVSGGNLDDSVSVSVLNPPVVTGGPRGSLTNAVVQGKAYPGATVTATASAFSCSATADASSAWSCALTGGITDGAYVVTASQATSWSSGASSPASAPVAIQIDVSVPAAPVVVAPRSGDTVITSGAVFSGTGEDGATVSVFAGAYSLCQVVVTGGAWTCAAAAVPAGTYNVAVLQQDPAGNVSVQSGGFVLTFQDAATQAPATPGDGATPPAAPGSPTDQAPGSPDSSSPSDAGSGTGPGGPSSSSPPAPGQDGVVPPGTPLPPQSGTWTDATGFTATLQPALGAGTAAVWWIALALGVLALLLIALPTRLLASTVATVAAREGSDAPTTAPRRVLASLLGRNRDRHEFERAPEIRVSPFVGAGATLLVAAAIVTLSSPVQNQPAYLRLFLAVTAALAVVNVVATFVPSAVAKAAFGVASSPRIRPALLIVCAALALVTRLAELEPALVFGLVTGLVAAEAAARADRGKLATAQVLGLIVLGSVAWLVSGAVGAQAGSPDLWGSALAEFLHVVVLASFGASSMLLLPVGRSSGRRILDWSPVTWVLLAVVSFTALSMLFVPALASAAGEGGVVVVLVAGLAFAAVSVSAWAWTRFVAVDAP